MIDWLDSEIQDDMIVYSLDKAKNRYEVLEIVPDKGWIVLNWDNERSWLKFSVLQFSRSDSDHRNILTNCVFHGEGPSDVLRECRHTYWGYKGYLFYPDGEIIRAAFLVLKQFFDDM